jgi:hypothetical protein
MTQSPNLPSWSAIHNEIMRLVPLYQDRRVVLNAAKPPAPGQIGLSWFALEHPARVEALFEVMTSSDELVRSERPKTSRRR